MFFDLGKFADGIIKKYIPWKTSSGKPRAVFSRVAQSTAESAGDLVGAAMEFMTMLCDMGLARSEDLPYFRLALDESVENALAHGNRWDPGKSISLEIKAEGRGIVITVRDEGEGFDPGKVPDPCGRENVFAPRGRGICLLRNLFTVQWTDGGRCVMIEWSLNN